MTSIAISRNLVMRFRSRLSRSTWDNSQLSTSPSPPLPGELEACSERQQGDVPGLLDGTRKTALVRSANAGQTTGHNLAALRDKALQQADVAIRNRIDLLG